MGVGGKMIHLICLVLNACVVGGCLNEGLYLLTAINGAFLIMNFVFLGNMLNWERE